MRKPAQLPIAWWILSGIGLLFISASFSYRFAKDEWMRIQQSQRTLTQLREFKRRADVQLREMRRLAEGEAPHPSERMEDVRLQGTVSFGDPAVRNLPEGYRHQQIPLELNGVESADVHQLLRRFENGQPPWRVTRLELETREGALRGALRLEALDKPTFIP